MKTNTEIRLYNFHSREKQKIDLKEVAKEECKELIDRLKKDAGIEVDIIRITNCEDFVKKYYEKKGFFVSGRGMYTWSYLPDAVVEFLVKKYNFDDNLLGRAGEPDFCIHNFKCTQEGGKGKEEIGEWVGEPQAFFVEVKSKTGAVQINQIDWMLSTKVPCYIAYIKRDDGD